MDSSLDVGEIKLYEDIRFYALCAKTGEKSPDGLFHDLFVCFSKMPSFLPQINST